MADKRRQPIIDKTKLANEVARLHGDSIRGTFPAYLGDPETKQVEVPIDQSDNAGMYFIHGISSQNYALADDEEEADDDKQYVTTAFMTPNKIMPGQLIYGTPVRIKKVGNRFIIVDLDDIPAAEYLYGVKDRLQRSIDVSQIDYGLIRPTNPKAFKVLVSGARYYLDGIAYDVPTLESVAFDDEIPTTLGRAKAVQILVDPTVPELQYVWSAQFVNNFQHSTVFPNYPNEVPKELFSAGWVKVYNGMVAVDIVDCYSGQEYLNKTSTPIPTPGSLFPLMISAAGETVVDDDGEVVWYEPDV